MLLSCECEAVRLNVARLEKLAQSIRGWSIREERRGQSFILCRRHNTKRLLALWMHRWDLTPNGAAARTRLLYIFSGCEPRRTERKTNSLSGMATRAPQPQRWGVMINDWKKRRASLRGIINNIPLLVLEQRGLLCRGPLRQGVALGCSTRKRAEGFCNPAKMRGSALLECRRAQSRPFVSERSATAAGLWRNARNCPRARRGMQAWSRTHERQHKMLTPGTTERYA